MKKDIPEFCKIIQDLDAYRRKDKNLKAAFGISVEDYLALLKSQDYKCLICGDRCQVLIGNKSRRTKTGRIVIAFAVDHCHKTGEIRGVLCDHCNRMLGYAKDNPVILLRAIQYLKGNLKIDIAALPKDMVKYKMRTFDNKRSA